MNGLDLAPLYRSTVGFDRMKSMLDASLISSEAAAGYPPYNIEKFGEDDYRVTLAVAGFTMDDLDIETRESLLIVRGKMPADDPERVYLHRGIAGRQFERQFALAEHVRVAGANLDNGLLSVDLVREVPEALRPRQIEITLGAPAAKAKKGPKVVEDKRAA